MTSFALAAAGTGGHVYPALAVADELQRRGVAAADIFFLGGNRIEARAVPAAGYELVELPLQGLVRGMTWRNLLIPSRLVQAARRAGAALVDRGAGALVAFGGYVTVPTAWAARREGVPYLLQEQNAVPGLANRAMARWAKHVFLGFPAAAARLPGEVAGNPLRRSLAEFDREALRAAALAHYSLPDGTAVLGVLGGSLGAQAINEAVSALAGGWEGPPVAIIHLAGASHAPELGGMPTAPGVTWRILPFENEMHHFYAASDLVVCRSSALTVSELAATGTPALLVPREVTRAGHYELNAAELTDASAAELVREADLRRLPAIVGGLLADGARLDAMRKAALERARVGAAARITDALLEVVRG